MTDGNMPTVQYQIPMAPAGYSAYQPPVYSNGGNNMFGDGNFMWFLLVWMAMFGWGGNNWGNNGGNGANLYRVDADMQRGFDQNAIMNKLDSLQQGQCSGFGGVNQNLSTGLAGVTKAVGDGFYQAEIAANGREMSSVTRDFAMQQGIEGLRYNIVDQGCQDRNALAMAVRDINDNANRNHQATMDKLCQLEYDGMKQNYEGQIRDITRDYESRIAALEGRIIQQNNDNQSLRFASAIGRQTGEILADNAAQTVNLERYLAPTAIPAYVVPNPNCCPQNYAWGYRQCS